MAHDPMDDVPEPVPVQTRRGGRAMLMLGVVGACALGVGAGLWARPAAEDQNPGLKPPEPPPTAEPTRKLQIVVDDSPAPIGQPIEVLPATGEAPRPAPPPVFVAPDPEPMAPVRPPAGLVRVQSVEPIVEAPPPRPEPKPKPEPRKVVEKPKVQKAAAKPERARPEKARLEKAERKPEPKAKKAAARKPAAKPSRARDKSTVAEAEAPKKHNPLSRFIAKLAPHHREAAKVQVAEAKPARAKRRTAEPARALHGGSVKVASARSRCVSPDPGAALVCADPSLSAADKRLSMAYSEAEAAGVSPSQLKRQQARWLQARSAAAREAPWAVHDVYLARIAELNDQAHEARGGGW